MTKSERWILSEWWVAKDRTLNFSDQLYYHREKTPYAEVDLVFGSTPGESPSVTLIEVKTISAFQANALWAGDMISRKQSLRLEKARWYFETKAQRPVRLLLAVVDSASLLKPQAETPRIRYFEAPF